MLSPGETVADRFEIHCAAGSGGMGTVYRASDRLTGRDVALKCVRDVATETLSRFARESVALSRIHHASVVRYVAHGTSPRSHAWLAMEWLDGEDLGCVLRRRGESARTLVSGGDGVFTPHLPIGDAITIARRVAGALAEIHRSGHVHRDLKPANVMLVDGDPARATLVDFGTCRTTESNVRLTRTGMLVGTPLYMAPEQACASTTVGTAADVWALGCLLYEMVAGAPPFHGDHVVAILAKIVLEEPPSIAEHRPDAPAALDALLRQLFSKDASLRPSAHEVEVALARIDESISEDVGSRPRIAAVGRAEQRFRAVLLGASDGTRSAMIAKAREIAAPFGGALSELAGGAFVATFTSTRAHATDVLERAARTAMAICVALPGLSLAVSCERSEGEATLGHVFDGAASTLGRTAKGRIALSAVAAELLDRKFLIRRHEEGIELVGARGIGTPARLLLGRPTECVGRERELGWFEDLFAECVDEPRARVALVTGPPGIGKSRLRHELVRRIERGHPSTLVLFATGDSLCAGAPFGLLGPAIRRAASIVDEESLDAKRTKLEALVARSVAPDERLRVAAFLGEAASVPFPDEAHGQLRVARREPGVLADSVAAAFETFVAAECENGPCVLVLEDVHWGDLPSIALVDAVLRLLAHRPFFVVATARSEVHSLFPGLFEARGAQELRLERLAKRAAEKLALAALPDADEATVAKVVARADGNPLFLEELLRAVATGRDDALPDTVLGVLEARLDSLGEDARRILRAASVFGESFALEDVAELVGRDFTRADVHSVLEGLIACEVVSLRRRDRASREGEYLFRHALLRDAAYATLPEADRRLAHQRAAEHFARHGGASALSIAEHFVRGGANDRAAPHFRRAAEEALEGNDLAGAIRCATRGLSLAPAAEERGALEAIVASASLWQGAHGDACAAAERALTDLPKGGALWFRVLGDAALAAGRSSDHERLLRILASANGQAADGTSAAHEARIVATSRATFQAIVSGVWTSREADASLARLERLAGDESLLAPTTVAQLHAVRGVAASISGDLLTFLEHTRATVGAFERASDVRNVTLETVTLAWCHLALGRTEEGLALATDACARARRLGIEPAITFATSTLGIAFAAAGRYADARRTLDDAIALSRRKGNGRITGYALGQRASIENRHGNPRLALEDATEAESLLASSPGFHTWIKAERAAALLVLGRTAEALVDARTAHAMLERLGGIVMRESSVALVFAEALLANGERDEAKVVLRDGRERVLRLAARIEDADHRKAFLEMPDNARTLVLATRFVGEAIQPRTVAKVSASSRPARRRSR